MVAGSIYLAALLGSFSYLMFQGQMRNIGAGKALLAMLLPMPLPLLFILGSKFKSPMHEAMAKEFHNQLPKNLFLQPLRLIGALFGRTMDVIEGNLKPDRPLTEDKALMYGYGGLFDQTIKNHPELGEEAAQTVQQTEEPSVEEKPEMEEKREAEENLAAREELENLKAEMRSINDTIFTGFNKVGEMYELQAVRSPSGKLCVGVPEERRAHIGAAFAAKGIPVELVTPDELEMHRYTIDGYTSAFEKGRKKKDERYISAKDIIWSEEKFYFDTFGKSVRTSWEVNGNESAGEDLQRMDASVKSLHRSFRNMLVSAGDGVGISKEIRLDIFKQDLQYEFPYGLGITSNPYGDGCRCIYLMADGKDYGSILCDPRLNGGFAVVMKDMEQFLESDSRTASMLKEFLMERFGVEENEPEVSKTLTERMESLTGPELCECWCNFVRRPENISVLGEQTTKEGFKAAEFAMKDEEARQEQKERQERTQTETQTETKTKTRTRKM